MKTTRLAIAAAALVGLLSIAARAQEIEYEPYEAEATATADYAFNTQPTVAMVPEVSTWHAGYYHVMWGRPVALVVPPTVRYETNYGWGIGNTRITPVYPQYLGPMNSAVTAMSYGPYRPTPYYVSDTRQFGVYYIRGPW